MTTDAGTPGISDPGYSIVRRAVEDARVRTVLSSSDVVDRVEQIELLGVEIVPLDKAAPLIDEQRSYRLTDAERGMRAGSRGAGPKPAALRGLARRRPCE